MTDALDLWDYRTAGPRHVPPGAGRWCREETGPDGSPPEMRSSPITRNLPSRTRKHSPALLHEYDPSWRITGRFHQSTTRWPSSTTREKARTRFLTIGTVRFELAGHDRRPEVLWLDAYGGIFLPFRRQHRATPPSGGRYLLDTVKGADLGHEDDMIILDFNYATTSCVHLPLVVPVGPPANRIEFSVEAGERLAT